MKKILISFIILELICLTQSCTYISFFGGVSIAQPSDSDQIIDTQKQNLGIQNFIKESEKYTQKSMPGIDLNDLLTTAISGDINNVKLIKLFLGMFGKEVLNSAAILGSIIIIIVIHSLLKSISDGLGSSSVSQVSYYVQYIMIVALVMTSFSQVINMVKESIENLVSFINLLIPILITLMITTGNVVSASTIEPIILLMVTVIGNFIVNIAIPMCLISTALGIVSQISDKIQIDKLAKFFRSSIVWMLGVILTLFVGVASLEGNLSGSIDGVTVKTTKAAVSNFIPVVGKILGDAVDTVMGCSVILKNALGIVGVIIIIGICIAPILKLTILMSMYYLASALCQPIADVKIIKLLGNMGDTFKLLLAILCGVSVMLIIGVTIIVKITG